MIIKIKNKTIRLIVSRFVCFVVAMNLFFVGYSQETNIAKYRIVTHSSSIDQNQTGHLVVDENSNTYWEAHYKDEAQSLLIDLDSQQDIKSLNIEWE